MYELFFVYGTVKLKKTYSRIICEYILFTWKIAAAVIVQHFLRTIAVNRSIAERTACETVKTGTGA